MPITGWYNFCFTGTRGVQTNVTCETRILINGVEHSRARWNAGGANSTAYILHSGIYHATAGDILTAQVVGFQANTPFSAMAMRIVGNA